MAHVLLDGGNFFHKKVADHRHACIAAWDEMARLGYAAVTLGDQELNAWDLTDSLLNASPLPVVCTNIEHRVGGLWRPLGHRYVITEVGGVRVGILSVFSEEEMPRVSLQQLGARYRILDPRETTRRVARELRDRVELLVLLAHLDPDVMEDYAVEFEEIDVIVGGHHPRNDKQPAQFGNTIVNRSGRRGQVLGQTRLVITPRGELVDWGGHNVTLERTFPENAEVAQIAIEAKQKDTEASRARRRQGRAGG